VRIRIIEAKLRPKAGGALLSRRGGAVPNWHKERVREHAHALWEADDRQHGNDLAHWFRAELENPLRVTFDSNTYRQVVTRPSYTGADPNRPKLWARDAPLGDLQIIHDALKGGRICGYLSETVVTLEGVENKDRVNVFGGRHLVRQARTSGDGAITIPLGLNQDRKPLNPGTSKWIDAARNDGMRFMMAGSRWFSGAGHLAEHRYTPELAARMDKVNAVARAIQACGVGYASAVCLGNKFNARAFCVGKLWFQGFQHAQSTEEREVKDAIKEWADGDSVAAHVGYGNDLFCSLDQGGKTGGKPSVLDKQHKAWLSAEYGVKFATLSSLAAMLL
jgi:hypothetical protein